MHVHTSTVVTADTGTFLNEFNSNLFLFADQKNDPIRGSKRIRNTFCDQCFVSPPFRPVKRTEPTDFSQMKQSQKRKLL